MPVHALASHADIGDKDAVARSGAGRRHDIDNSTQWREGPRIVRGHRLANVPRADGSAGTRYVTSVVGDGAKETQREDLCYMGGCRNTHDRADQLPATGYGDIAGGAGEGRGDTAPARVKRGFTRRWTSTRKNSENGKPPSA